jgi:hypothetical protein
VPRLDTKPPPPAQTSVLETAATADSPPDSAGVGTMLYAVPSQCSASSWLLPVAVSADPTAQTSPAEMLATALSWLLPGEASGLATTAQGAVCAWAAGASSSGLYPVATASGRMRVTDNLSLMSFLLPL